MQNRSDRAGDAGGRIRRRSLGISFLMHCAGIFVLFASPWNRTSKAAYEIFPVQVIDIPEMELPKEPPPPSEKPETKPVLQEKTAPAPKTKSAVKTEQPAVRPAPRVPAFSADKYREALTAKMGKSSREIPAANTSETSPAKTMPLKVEKIESSVTEVNTPSLNLTVPQWYILTVQSRIKANWRTHNILGSRTTTVSFRIYRNGRIDNIALEKSSGNTGFDKSVVDSVRATQDLPPFPREIPDVYLDIVIDFKTEG